MSSDYVIPREIKGPHDCLASAISLAISVKPSAVYRFLKLLSGPASDRVRPRGANLSALCKGTEAADSRDAGDGGWVELA
jgi:hypothetical protein